jgi:hypothetical protein
MVPSGSHGSSGKILIQADVVGEYLKLVGWIRLPEWIVPIANLRATDKSRFHQLENEPLCQRNAYRKPIRTKSHGR